MNIFLTGATGFLGGRLVQNLLEQEHTVFILARNLEKAEGMKARLPHSFQESAYHSGRYCSTQFRDC